METKEKCIKCQKPVSKEEGKKTKKGYLCQDCAKKAKITKTIILAVIILAVLGCCIWLILRPEHISGFDGTGEIQENVVVDVPSLPFSISNTVAIGSNDMSILPIDNLESFKQILEKSKAASEAEYNSLTNKSAETIVSLAIPLIANYFDFNSSVISANAETLLKEYSTIYKQTNMSASILVEGFACNIGTDECNDKISNDRAIAVRNFLIGNGVPADKINVKSYGRRRNGEFKLSSISDYRRVLISIQ